MLRISILCIVLVLPALAQEGLKDPAFAKIPFDQWFKEGNAAHFKWSVEVADPVLSSHQRMMSRVRIKVDGAELAARRGEGEFVMLIQITDESGRVWQVHDAMDLDKVQEAARANDFEFLQPFFALPGQYTLSVATYDTVTKEHNVARRKLTIPRLKSDPFPESWKTLPAIEFLRSPGVPDAWYLPNIEGRLNLPVTTKPKQDVEVIVNLTASERPFSPAGIQNRTLGALIPALKTILQTQWSDAKVDVTFLDLSRRRITFRQDDVKAFDWDKAMASLSEATPGIIDVKALEQRKHSAEFFVAEIQRRMAPTEGRPRAVIVLSSPVYFDTGVDVHGISAPERTDAKIFYFRYQPVAPERKPVVPIPLRTTSRGLPIENIPLPPPFELDQLEPLLKSLNPRLFEVTTPEQFRKALASMFSEVGQH